MACTASAHEKHHLHLLAALNILFSITASLGNILIFIALRKEPSLHPPSKLLFQCLAATDLCVGLFSQPLFAVELISIALQRLQLCYTVVKANDIAGRTLSAVSLWTLTAISVDRLLALVLGLRYKQTVTLRRMLGIVICIWIVNITVFCTLRLWLRSVTFWVISALIFTFLMVSTFCYITIYLNLRHHQVEMQEQANEGQPNRGRIPLNIARYRKTVSTALWVHLVLVVCYLPYGVDAFVSHFNVPYNYLSSRVTVTLILFNSSLNPILYCWKIRGVRQAVKDIIRQTSCFSCQ